MDLRRTIDEIIALYTFEPELRDLYVEGTFDRTLYGWFFDGLDCDAVSIFDIDTVDIGNEFLVNLGLNIGNRGRVLALALTLESSLPSDAKYVRCIVDLDFDHILGDGPSCKYLLYTDYTSPELYLLNESVIGKVMVLGLVGGRVEDVNVLVEEITSVLYSVFIMRAANQKLGWGMRLVGIRRSLEIRDGEIRLDEEQLTSQYLSSDGRLPQIQEFQTVKKELTEISFDDHRQCIHGDDLIDLLGWYIAKHSGRRSTGIGRHDMIRTIFFPALELEQLSSEALFQNLTNIYCDS